MGWSGGTSIFDEAVEVVQRFAPDAPLEDIVECVYVEIDWDDWDTQDESDYFDPYLRNVMLELGERDEDDFI